MTEPPPGFVLEEIAAYLEIPMAVVQFLKAEPREATRLLGFEYQGCPNVRWGRCTVPCCGGSAEITP